MLRRHGRPGCITGTIRTEVDVVEGAEVNVTGPDGFDETAVSDDGKWSFTVTEPGNYTVTSTPSRCRPESSHRRPGHGQGDHHQPEPGQGRQLRRPHRVLQRRASAPSTSIIQSTVNGLRLGLLLALASVGLSLIYGTTGLSNFAHAEQVTLGGMLGYLVRQPVAASARGSAARSSS